MAYPRENKRSLMVALAAAAVGAGLSVAGILIRNRILRIRELQRREDLLDMAITETMDASDAVAKY